MDTDSMSEDSNSESISEGMNSSSEESDCENSSTEEDEPKICALCESDIQEDDDVTGLGCDCIIHEDCLTDTDDWMLHRNICCYYKLEQERDALRIKVAELKTALASALAKNSPK